jgi:hypothetical protein
MKNHPDPGTGAHVIDSLEHPTQSIPDMLRSGSDFITFGANDRLRAWLKGTSYADEKQATEQADTRLGSLDDAAKLGGAMVAPSAAAGYAPEAGALGRLGQWGKSALGWAGEGAGQAGAQAVIKGEDPVSAMEKGAAFGSAGKLMSSLRMPSAPSQWVPSAEKMAQTKALAEKAAHLLKGGDLDPSLKMAWGVGTGGKGPALGYAIGRGAKWLPNGIAAQSVVSPDPAVSRDYLARMMLGAGRL